jgi:hypothetical protein
MCTYRIIRRVVSVRRVPTHVPIRLAVRDMEFLPYRSLRCLTGLLVSGACEAEDIVPDVVFY